MGRVLSRQGKPCGRGLSPDAFVSARRKSDVAADRKASGLKALPSRPYRIFPGKVS
ncbi:hypothetical protein [Lysobacter gummosus]|uniref:hypothetical protein n=1 Tax=Lysobacter gummosus TaxID=262324 RepID=UPI00072093DD|nr:hypothetical protein LG3211_2383 [Lysobacter gummosus]